MRTGMEIQTNNSFPDLGPREPLDAGACERLREKKEGDSLWTTSTKH